MNLTASQFERLAEIAPSYFYLRKQHQEVPARKIVDYVKHGDGESFEVFCCPGHRWIYTGTQYGGDDESYRGEGRVYCANCGADGDA
jgi:hypothetical protein